MDPFVSTLLTAIANETSLHADYKRVKDAETCAILESIANAAEAMGLYDVYNFCARKMWRAKALSTQDSADFTLFVDQFEPEIASNLQNLKGILEQYRQIVQNQKDAKDAAGIEAHRRMNESLLARENFTKRF